MRGERRSGLVSDSPRGMLRTCSQLPARGDLRMAGEMESARVGQGGASCREGVGSPGFASAGHSAALLSS